MNLRNYHSLPWTHNFVVSDQMLQLNLPDLHNDWDEDMWKGQGLVRCLISLCDPKPSERGSQQNRQEKCHRIRQALRDIQYQGTLELQAFLLLPLVEYGGMKWPVKHRLQSKGEGMRWRLVSSSSVVH